MILDSTDTKQRILGEFLKLCPFEGWSDAALRKAMENCGVGENFAQLVFEGGLLELAEFYIESQNRESAKKIAEISDFHHRKIRDKIRLSIYARFEVEKEHKLALQRLINFYLNPKNLTSFEMGPKPMAQGLSACYKVADFIWENIGDQSTDFNFYTKRLTLAKIIFRALPVFLKDESHDFEKTKKLIDSEIEKVMKFEKYKAQAKKVAGVAGKKFCEAFLDERGELKTPVQFVKDLPFIRLIKFK